MFKVSVVRTLFVAFWATVLYFSARFPLLMLWVVLGGTLVIYAAFTSLMSVKRMRAAAQKIDMDLPLDMLVWAYVMLAVGWPADVIFNWSRGVWLFKELPREYTFSDRIQRHWDMGEGSSNPRVAHLFAVILNAADPNPRGHIHRVPT